MKKSKPRTKERKPRKLLKRAALLIMLLSVAGVCVSGGQYTAPTAHAEEEAPMPKRKGRTVMYIMDAHNLNLREGDAHALDQLNYSFALIKDGKADGAHWLGLKKVQSFLKKHPHVDGVLSIGGWGADGFSQACMTEDGRQTLADSLLALMDECGFVGIDVDWEYPGVPGTGILSQEGDVENWYAFLTLLREGLDARETLHGREYHLSVALGAGENHLKVLDAARLGKLVDQTVVMAYDLSGFDRITGHHAGLYADQNKPDTGAYAVKKLVEGGFPAEKILLGMPAYGRVWRQVSGGGDGLDQRANTSGNKTISFDELLRLEKQGYTRYYDEKAQAAWWFDGSTFVSGEDDRSIAAKGAWIVDNDLMGAAVWQYTQDADGAMLSMLDAAMR
ncbi:MAG: hypothetical protein IJA77_00750 [Clostridia bacterium]|nr:hypothetical protein [Clostridia bacterium]